MLGRPQSKLEYSQGKKYDEHIHVQINSVINLIPDILHLLPGTVCATVPPPVHTWRQSMPTTTTPQADQQHSGGNNVVSMTNSVHGEN